MNPDKPSNAILSCWAMAACCYRWAWHPIGLQWALMGLQSGEMGETNLGDFWFVYYFCYCMFGVYGVLYYPKMASPVIFQYFLNDLGNLDNLVKNWTRGPPSYYQNASNATRKSMESSWENIILSIWDSHFVDVFEKCMSSVPCISLFFLWGNVSTYFKNLFVERRIGKW